MKLVIDSNIVFSALISPNGITKRILLLEELELFGPQNLFDEINKYKEEIFKKSGLTQEQFEIFLIVVSSRINLITDEELADFIEKADEICPDPNDTAFFALSMAKGIPLWSNDKELKKQNVVKVINTEELVKMID